MELKLLKNNCQAAHLFRVHSVSCLINNFLIGVGMICFYKKIVSIEG